MAATRRSARHGDGSAAVRGWVDLYTLGLPRAIRERRRQELHGELAEEWLDAVRRSAQAGLRRQRWGRLVRGIPDDLAWRVSDARRAAAALQGPARWVPLTRWSLALLGIVAIGAGGGFSLVALPYLGGTADPSTWLGWGPFGFMVGSAGILLAVPVAVAWPGRALAIVIPSVAVGVLAAPWLWGCWCLGLMAIVGRHVQARQMEGPDRP